MTDFTPETDEVLDAYRAGLMGMTRSVSKYQRLEAEFHSWLAQVKADERAKVLSVVQARHYDLANCHKDDDCHLLAKGIWLAMDDVYEKFERSGNE